MTTCELPETSQKNSQPSGSDVTCIFRRCLILGCLSLVLCAAGCWHGAIDRVQQEPVPVSVPEPSPTPGPVGVIPDLVAAPKEEHKRVIVLDPGHGGEEEGAIGIGGLKEKDVVLDIALILKGIIQERMGAQVLLTRSDDRLLALAERTALANDNNADLFLSIHTNATLVGQVSGLETYYLDNTQDRASLRLAKYENQSVSGGALDDLSFILSDLVQNGKLEDSISLAHYVQTSLYEEISKQYPGIQNLGVKKGPFFVLVGAHMPCVLAEVSFIDHHEEGARLGTREYRQKIAEGLFTAISHFYEEKRRNRPQVSQDIAPAQDQDLGQDGESSCPQGCP